MTNLREDELSNFFSGGVVGSRMVAAKGQAALEEYRKQEPGTVLSFGLANLDAMIRMLRGNYYLVAARARTGKSALLMQVADHAMRQLQGTGRLVVIFSAEMDAASLALREACALERLSYWKMAIGQLAPDEYDRIRRRLETIAESGFWLDESSAPTLEHMAEQLAAITESGAAIGLVCFDYLELGGDFAADEARRLSKIGRGLKAIAKRFDCPVLALGQLNRNIERDKDKQLGLSDLAYGGEKEPDGIIILNRPWLLDDTKDPKWVDVAVVKHRQGAGGKCVLSFDQATMRFQNARVERIPLTQEKGETVDA